MSEIADRPSAGADMLMFWERGRLAYNIVLAMIVVPNLALAIAFWPIFLVLAIIANAFYCIAYPVDIVMQNSVFASAWLRVGRWLVLLLGTVIAAGLAASFIFGPMGPIGQWD